MTSGLALAATVCGRWLGCNKYFDRVDCLKMASQKLAWSLSSCHFCPRLDVRTCHVKSGKLLPKLCAALELEEALLGKAEGICTCCYADVDMILRAIAIRGAMQAFFLNCIQVTPIKPADDQPIKSVEVKTVESSTLVKEEPYASPQNALARLQQGYSSPDLMLNGNEIEGEIECEDLWNGDLLSSPVSQSPPSVTLTSEFKSEEFLSPSTVLKKRRVAQAKYQCLLCDKVAGSKSHCMEHMITHSNLRPFTCLDCGKCFKSHKACREHLRAMHSMKNQDHEIPQHMSVNQIERIKLEEICHQFKPIVAQYEVNGFKEPISPQNPPEPYSDASFSSVTDTSNTRMHQIGPQQVFETVLPPRQHKRKEALLLQRQTQSRNYIKTPCVKKARKGTPHKAVVEDGFPDNSLGVSHGASSFLVTQEVIDEADSGMSVRQDAGWVTQSHCESLLHLFEPKENSLDQKTTYPNRIKALKRPLALDNHGKNVTTPSEDEPCGVSDIAEKNATWFEEKQNNSVQSRHSDDLLSSAIKLENESEISSASDANSRRAAATGGHTGVSGIGRIGAPGIRRTFMLASKRMYNPRYTVRPRLKHAGASSKYAMNLKGLNHQVNTNHKHQELDESELSSQEFSVSTPGIHSNATSVGCAKLPTARGQEQNGAFHENEDLNSRVHVSDCQSCPVCHEHFLAESLLIKHMAAMH